MSKDQWLQEAVSAAEVVFELKGEGGYFITDDIWAELERRGVEHPPEPRWMGDLINALKSREWIKSDGVVKTLRGSRNKGYVTRWVILP